MMLTVIMMMVVGNTIYVLVVQSRCIYLQVGGDFISNDGVDVDDCNQDDDDCDDGYDNND